jgi:long-chain acyl-CoA synthetase
MNTLKSLIEESISRNSNKSFLADCGLYFTKKYSYQEIYSNSLKICSLFEKKKIKKGDKILIYLPNSSNYVSLLFACALSGVIAVPIDFNSNPEFARKIVKITLSKIVFCSVFKRINFRNLFFVEEIDKIYNGFEPSNKRNDIRPSDVFEIVYTSGTTSNPKGVILTQKNLHSEIIYIKNSNILNIKNPSMLSILPLSHLFEQTVGLLYPMYLGTLISYTESKKGSELLHAIKKQKINAMVSVPFFLDSLRSKIISKSGEKINFLHKILIKKSFGRLRFFLVGGSSLSLETERFWRNLGFELLQGYGLTETSPVLTCNSKKFYKEGTVGKSLAGIELKLKNKEVLARGDNIFRGYYQDSKNTREVKKNGWFYTGDLGEIDSEGYLRIVGRKKNVIISSSGLNIYPEDIEGVLNRLVGVKVSVVLGLNNGRDLVGVIIQTKEVDLSELMKSANKILNSSQQLTRLVPWVGRDFPRTTTLKIIRRDVERQISMGSSEVYSSGDVLITLICSICGCFIKDIKENSKLVNLGLDSIKRIELVNKIEESFNIELDEKKINDKTTISLLRKEIEHPQKIKSKPNINFLNSKIFNPIRFMLQWVSFIGLRFFYSIHVEGKENLPPNQCILIANHTSMLDTFALYRALPFRYQMNTCPAAAKDFFFKNKITGFFGKMTFNVFGFSRKEEAKQSLRDFGELVNRGMNVLIYPEGTRSRTGKLLDFKEGIGVIASNIHLPIVPIKIEGLHKILPVGEVWPKRGSVKIKIGRPVSFCRIDSPQEITKNLHKIIGEM